MYIYSLLLFRANMYILFGLKNRLHCKRNVFGGQSLDLTELQSCIQLDSHHSPRDKGSHGEGLSGKEIRWQSSKYRPGRSSQGGGYQGVISQLR